MRLSTALKTILTRRPMLIAAAGVGAVGILGGGAVALQADLSQATAAAAPSNKPSCAPSKSKGHKHQVAAGKVTAIDAGSITIQGAGGKTKTFALNASTKVRGPGKKTLDLGAVKVGDHVAVRAAKSPGSAAAGILDYGPNPPTPHPHHRNKPSPCPK